MPLVVRLDPELEVGLRMLSEEASVSQAELVRQLIRERLGRRTQRKTAFEIAQALGVIGIDPDPRRSVARQHSKHVRASLLGQRSR